MTIRRMKMNRRKSRVIRKRKKIFLSFVLITTLLISLRSSYSVFAGNKLVKVKNFTAKLNTISEFLPNTENYVQPIDGLILSKTASIPELTGNPDIVGRQIFQIDLKAEAKSVIKPVKKPADIVLVLDNSGSLSGNTDDAAKPTRQETLINSAENFVNYVAQFDADNKIAVVNAKNNDVQSTELLSVNNDTNKNTIINAIKNLTTKGDSVVEQGLEKAFNIYNETDYDPNRLRVTILVTGKTAGGTVMADSIQWSTILKGSNSKLIDPSDIKLDNSDGTAGYPKPANGCEAKIYSIGIFAAAANDTNEYLWRVSSNSPSGMQAAGENYLPNDENSYYLTADKAAAINDIFNQIAEQFGTSLKNAVVRDYINTYFDFVDSTGKILNVGDTITIGSNTGTIMQDEFGIYVEWPVQEIAPPSADGQIPAKTFTGSVYVKPKVDFIGGNNIPTNIENISAVYDGDTGTNIGSFPYPLVNVPYKFSVGDIKDYILLGEDIPKSKTKAQNIMFTNNLNKTYKYPEGIFDDKSYVWNPDYTADTKPVKSIDYELTVIPNPVDYITDPIPEHYNTAVGTLANSSQSEKGVYTVIPVKPDFTGSTYNIFLGETAGDGGASTLANAVNLTIPNSDISGKTLPAEIKVALTNRLTAYKDSLTFSVTSKNPDSAPDYTDPLSGYTPVENTTLYLNAISDNMPIEKDIPVIINVRKGTLVINKAITGDPNPNQTFVFEIKEYSDINKTSLVRTFYETIRTSGYNGTRNIIYLPKGYYEVSEKYDWSWQYDLTTKQIVSGVLGMNSDGSRNVEKASAETSFVNASKKFKWLNSIDWVINKFTGGVN